MNIESIKQCIEKIEKELVELKAYVDEVKIENTPNQLRAELIEKAKSFVEIKSSYLRNSTECDGGYEVKKQENPNHCMVVTKCEFIVNEEKNTIVALLKYLDNSIRTKSIAKCNPSDVFNEHIGKAIALGRVLGLDVSEFEQAVKPTVTVKGHKVKWNYSGNLYNVQNIEGDEYILYSYLFKKDLSPVYYDNFNDFCEIINDTNAQYGGVE